MVEREGRKAGRNSENRDRWKHSLAKRTRAHSWSPHSFFSHQRINFMVQQSISQRCFLTSPSLHAALSPLRPRSPLALSPHSRPEGLESQFLRARLLLPRHLHHPSGFSSFPFILCSNSPPFCRIRWRNSSTRTIRSRSPAANVCRSSKNFYRTSAEFQTNSPLSESPIPCLFWVSTFPRFDS